MQQISEFEQRITAALERIGKGIDRMGAASRPAAAAPAVTAAPPQAADAALRARLEEEKALTAQLQDRLRAAKAKESPGDLQDKVDRLTRQLDVQGLELQRMRRTSSALADQLAVLRQAQTAGVTEPQMINRALQAELDAVRAQRLSEVAEMDEILSALAPHIAETGHARA